MKDENTLIFQTSSDATMYLLFKELGDNRNIDCLIPSSKFNRYKSKYPYVNFIDIQREGFYDLPTKIIKIISEKNYEQLYVTFSGIKGHNYGNVMEFVSKAHFKKAFFYNCNGDKEEIPKPSIIKDMLCRAYIEFISSAYGLRRG